MNNLISVRTNILYTKDIEGNFIKNNELVFLVSNPKYSFSNQGVIIQERSVEEFRLTISNDKFGDLIKLLEQLKEADEKDLG